MSFAEGQAPVGDGTSVAVSATVTVVVVGGSGCVPDDVGSTAAVDDGSVALQCTC